MTAKTLSLYKYLNKNDCSSKKMLPKAISDSESKCL